jgi:hypothetical protein
MLLPALSFYPAIINKHIAKLNFNQPHPIVYLQTMCHFYRFKFKASRSALRPHKQGSGILPQSAKNRS